MSNTIHDEVMAGLRYAKNHDGHLPVTQFWDSLEHRFEVNPTRFEHYHCALLVDALKNDRPPDHVAVPPLPLIPNCPPTHVLVPPPPPIHDCPPTHVAVPEPTTWIVFAVGIIGFFAIRQLRLR